MKLPLRDFADVIAAIKGPNDKSFDPEKRGSARITVTAKINVHLLKDEHVARSFSALTRDVSISGCGLMQAMALTPQQRIVIVLPRVNAPLYVISKALHCRPLADGLLAVGCEFIELLDEDRFNRMMAGDSQQFAHIQASILS